MRGRAVGAGRRGRGAAPLVVAAALLGGVVACGDPAPPNVATYDADGSGMDALLVGTLRVTEACVTVEGEDGSPTVPVFPRGEVSTGADGLEFGGRTYADGDRIELGGGEGSPGASAGIPAGCPDVARWVVAPHDG